MYDNKHSIFPLGIDSRIYFSDISIEQLGIMNTYRNLLLQNKFSEAFEYISQHKVDGYFAGLFNYIENMIYNTQKYLYEKEKYNPFRCSQLSEEPENISCDEFWIDGE